MSVQRTMYDASARPGASRFRQPAPPRALGAAPLERCVFFGPDRVWDGPALKVCENEAIAITFVEGGRERECVMPYCITLRSRTDARVTGWYAGRNCRWSTDRQRQKRFDNRDDATSSTPIKPAGALFRCCSGPVQAEPASGLRHDPAGPGRGPAGMLPLTGPNPSGPRSWR
jgi:hypothetical protein